MASSQPPQAQTTAFSEDQLRAFLSFLMDPATGAIEFRAFKADYDRGRMIVKADRYSKTIAGWYDDVNSLVIDAKTLRGVSGYMTVNPVHPDLLSRSCNRTIVTKNATNDEQVICFRWLYIDIDPIRESKTSDISSSEEELADAIRRRDTILAEHAALKNSALWGCSGNGAWILVRLPDYPINEASGNLIARALKSLSDRYSDEKVAIDVKTKNPSRVMCLPGTLKCKGIERGDRRWRLVTFDSLLSDEAVSPPQPIDLLLWVAEYPPLEPPNEAPKSYTDELGKIVRQPAHFQSRNLTQKYALSALEKEASILSATAPGNRNNQLNLSTVKLGELVAAHVLNRDHVEQVLALSARRAGLDDPDIFPTIASGMKKGLSQPRNLSVVGSQESVGTNGQTDLNGHVVSPLPPKGAPDGETRQSESQQSEEPSAVHEGTFKADDDPHRLARLFLAANHIHPEGLTLRYWQEEFYYWNGSSYAVCPIKEVKALLTSFIEEEFNKLHIQKLIQHTIRKAGGDKGSEKEKPPKALQVTTVLVANVIQALSGLCLLAVRHCPSQPAWARPHEQWQPRDILVAQNGLIHLPSLVLGRPYRREPTPAFFTPNSVTFNFDENPPDPINWLTFLGARPVEPDSEVRLQLWPDDPQCIDTLQEWFGLNLVADTRYQKMLALIGPRRSGKGTIARTMAATIGEGNISGPTLSGLTTQFGLAPMIGKLAAIISDARLSGRTDQAIIVERLLSITGEDLLTIDRKHMGAWTGRFMARITLISNELPRLADSSGALSGRLILLRLTRSFYGQEDENLESKLKCELPGILGWAIKGWKRLRERGRFIQPDSGRDMIDEMEYLASPIGAFLKERCIVSPGHRTGVGDLFHAWTLWCTEQGRKEPGDQAVFGRNLRAVLPHLKTKQGTQHGSRIRYFEGVGLLYPPPNSEVTPQYGAATAATSAASLEFGEAGEEGEKESGDETPF